MKALRKLRERFAEDLNVDERVPFPGDEWEFRDGRLTHRGADFFELVGERDPDGRESLFLRQEEMAFIGLLTTVVDGERYVLLHARAEPGLTTWCQISTTIQSTPSNYLRKHGGAPTPYLDDFFDPGPGVHVLHDSLQYDWGRYYATKIKRFLIIETDEPRPESPLHVWVTEAELRALLTEDRGVTSDLRVAALLLLDGEVTEPAPEVPESLPTLQPTPVPVEELKNWRIHEHGIDEIERDQGFTVRYVRTRTTSREVDEWAQPLLADLEPIGVRLVTRTVDGVRECAVRRRTDRGLRGVEIWYPAELRDEVSDLERVAGPIVVSAEGGRFLAHDVTLEVFEGGPEHVEPEAEWISVNRVRAAAAQQTQTSLELRFALSLILEPQR